MVDFGSPAWNAMKAGQTPSWESVKQIYTQNGRTFRDFVADYYPNGPGANQELRIPPRPNPEVPGESQVLDWPAIKQAWQQRLGARVPATQSSGGPPALPPSSTGASAGAPQPGGAVEPYVMQGQAIPPEGAPGGLLRRVRRQHLKVCLLIYLQVAELELVEAGLTVFRLDCFSAYFLALLVPVLELCLGLTLQTPPK